MGTIIVQENAELKKKANDTWNEIYSNLTSAARMVAKKAAQDAKLSSEAAHKYFMSGR